MLAFGGFQGWNLRPVSTLAMRRLRQQARNRGRVHGFFQCALNLTPVFPAILQYVRGLCRPFDFKSRRNLALDYLPTVGSTSRFRAKKRYIALKRDLR